MQGIEQLIKKKFSLIPLQKDTKIPIVKWKKYQYKRATIEEVLNWYTNFGDINIGIVTGSISKLANIDADDKNQLPTLEKMIPELWLTTRVKTPRAGRYHFYFSTNGDKVKSASKLLGLKGIELKSEGTYVVAPGSVVDGVRYEYERPLRELKPLPKFISDEYKKVDGAVSGVPLDLTIPKLKARCVSQILNYDLPVGQRKKAYHIAYCKMRQEGHKKSYAIYVCKEANKRLSKPLRNDEFDFGKIYNYGCPRINEELSFINCSNCQVRGGFRVSSLAMRSFHKLKSLTNTQRAILLILDTYFKGLVGEELPTIYEIQKYSDTNINYYTIKNALEVLKEKEII